MNADDALQQLRTLSHDGFGCTELTILRLEDSTTRVVATGFFTDPGGLVAAAAEHNGEANIYVGVNPRPADWATGELNGVRRAKDEDIEHITALVLDVDPAGRGTGELGDDAAHERALEVARAIADDLGGALVDSGGGAQIILPLSAPVPVADLGDLALFKQRQSAWRNELVARHDTTGVTLDATQALSHPCRLAGTRNIKGAGRDTAWLHDARDFADAILEQIHGTEVPRLGPGGADAQPVELPDDLPPVDVAELKISDRMKALIGDGDADERYASRSEAVFAVACAMVAAGHSDAATAAVLLHETNAISERAREQRDPRRHVTEEIARARARTPVALDLPTIIVTNRHLRDVGDEALEALNHANDPPFIFVRAARVSRVCHDENGRPIIGPVGENALRGHLARAANFVKLTKVTGKPGEWKQGPVAPPLDVTRDVGSRGEWPFPPLAGITEVPVLRADGSVLDVAGYDRDTAMLYRPSADLDMPPVPEHPTAAQVTDAIALLLGELLGDFPFTDAGSRANALALLLTPIIRSLIPGCVPLALLDAPEHGTGKTLIAEVVSIIATGRSAALMSAPTDEEEWRKRLTSILAQGSTVVTIDNVDDPLESTSLAAILTARTFSDRILGETRMVELPVRCTWAATGNNILVRGDLPRRCYLIRLDAQRYHPWERGADEFQHPLPEWAHEARERLLVALLTICRAWAAGGCEKLEPRVTLGGFEDWQRIVGAILATAGVEGFLSNLESFYEAADDDREEWVAFLSAWHDALGFRPITLHSLAADYGGGEDYDGGSNIMAHCPGVGRDRDGTINTRRLAHALRERANVRMDGRGLHVENTGAKTRRRILWRVTIDDDAGGGGVEPITDPSQPPSFDPDWAREDKEDPFADTNPGGADR